MWITSDVDIMRCTVSVWEPLPQAKAVVRSYCFCPAYFRETACSKPQQKVVVYFSLFNFYIAEFLFVGTKISVSWYHSLLIITCAVMVFKIPFYTKLCTMAEEKYSPCPENVRCTYRTINEGRELSELWKNRWTALLSTVVLVHLGEKTEFHPFTPSENLAQSTSPLFPLRTVSTAWCLTAYHFTAKQRAQL